MVITVALCVVQRLSLLHSFIQLTLNSGSPLVQILLAECRRFGKIRISHNWSRLEIKINAFCRSTIQQKQFIISTSCFFKINKGSYEKNKSVKNNIVPSNKTKKQERLVYNQLIVFFSRNIFFFLGLVFNFLLLCMVCELSIHYLFPGGTQFCCF